MTARAPRTVVFCVGIATLAGCFATVSLFTSSRLNATASGQSQTALSTDDASLLDGFRHAEVASISDAAEKVTGKKVYMSHHMRPLFPAKFAGFAVTVLMKKEVNHDPAALDGMLAAIDQGAP